GNIVMADRQYVEKQHRLGSNLDALEQGAANALHLLKRLQRGWIFVPLVEKKAHVMDDLGEPLLVTGPRRIPIDQALLDRFRSFEHAQSLIGSFELILDDPGFQ